ncbi:MAG: hypothetical protein RR626_03025 [Anaerovoracaceae bacterium]
MKNEGKIGRNKRIALGVICIVFCMLCIPTKSQAVSSYGDFEYDETDAVVSIHSYLGNAKEVAIPAAIEGKPVIEIQDYAFLFCDMVEKIIVPDTVTYIGQYAFDGAPGLISVVRTDGTAIPIERRSVSKPKPQEAQTIPEVEEELLLSMHDDDGKVEEEEGEVALRWFLLPLAIALVIGGGVVVYRTKVKSRN